MPMSKVYLHGVKDLKISAPTKIGSIANKLKGKVILIAKYDFNSESADELSVKKGDVLKLLDKISNGWVLVEFIDKIASPGLVPSLYVDIGVNDPMNPITLSWLHESKTPGSSSAYAFNDIQVEKLLEDNSPLSINNKLYPLTVSVTNYLMFENRFWYRVDVTYSSGEQGYLARYYSDFYDLHSRLLEYLSHMAQPISGEPQLKLPKLPEPVPSQKRASAEQQDLFSKRCRELSAYMSELISVKRFQVCTALVDWLSEKYNGLPGFVVQEAPNDSSDVINQRILPGSVILGSKNMVPTSSEIPSDANKSLDSSKYFVPSKGGPKTPKSKNIYNHYQQAANAKVNFTRSMSTNEGPYPGRKTSQLGRSKTVSTPGHQNQRKNSNTASSPHNDIYGSPKKSGNNNGGTNSSSTPSTPQLQMSKSFKHTASGVVTPRKTPTQKYVPESHHAQTPSKSVVIPRSTMGLNAESNDHGMQTPSSANVTLQTAKISSGSPSSSPYDTPTARKSQKIPPGLQLRCEVKTSSNDQIVIRLDKKRISSAETFRYAVYQKFAFNNLFIKLKDSDSYEEVDSLEEEDIKTILSHEKVLLLVT